MMQISKVEGGYIVVTDHGRDTRVFASWRKLLQYVTEQIGPSKHPSDEDMSGQIEQPNQ